MANLLEFGNSSPLQRCFTNAQWGSNPPRQSMAKASACGAVSALPWPEFHERWKYVYIIKVKIDWNVWPATYKSCKMERIQKWNDLKIWEVGSSVGSVFGLLSSIIFLRSQDLFARSGVLWRAAVRLKYVFPALGNKKPVALSDCRICKLLRSRHHTHRMQAKICAREVASVASRFLQKPPSPDPGFQNQFMF